MKMSMTQDELMAFMRERAYRPLTADEMLDVFDLPPADHDPFQKLLERLEAQGRIVKNRAGRYGLPEKMNLVVGALQGHEKGFGFILPDKQGEEDVFIRLQNMNGAMHQDRVIARLLPDQKGDRRAGEILRILERGNRRIVGNFERKGNFAFVVPDEKRIHQDVFVASNNFNGATTGDKVVVEITEWPAARRSPEGRVVERLGKAQDPGVDIEAILVKHDLPRSFPAAVEREAEATAERVQAGDIRGRSDYRQLLTVTIDGADARDFDDAVTLQRDVGSGRWRLGVHIADVSHYVKDGSALDQEARKRACSVYLVDRVIPMLPQRLSNGICSLNPAEDRLTVSVLMDFDEEGARVDFRMTPSVIHSDHRLTYRDVAAVLDGESTDLDAPLRKMLLEMGELAEALGRKRWQRGSLDFDFPETKVILDEDGDPVDVQARERTAAHRLIEEFMLAANETVAEHVERRNAPLLYRVHEEPAAQKLNDLSDFVKHFGYQLDAEAAATPKALQQLLEAFADRKEQSLVQTVALRSLQRARYSPENLGHYGLASRYYAHFTSPIRRYPDLVVHRIVKQLVADEDMDARTTGRILRGLPQVAEHCSVRERVAEEAERESVDMKAVQFMATKIDETFDGIISGVTNFGLFIMLPNTVEGLVHVSHMNDDYYQFDSDRLALMGERTGQQYRLGDAVRVRLVGVDRLARQIDLRLVKDEDDAQQTDDEESRSQVAH